MAMSENPNPLGWKHFSLWLPKAMRKLIKMHAWNQDRPSSHIIREAIQQWLDRNPLA